MDEYETGPQNFSIYLDITKESGNFTAQLVKPLNFSAGIWEVALGKLIFKIKKIEPNRVLKVLTDLIVPQVYGSKHLQILALHVLPSKPQVFSSTSENPIYVQVLGSYISSINIQFIDNFDKELDIDEQFPIILQLHFRKNGIFSKK